MTYVIAEAGTGHASWQRRARLRKARNLITAAWEAGADAVKFQLFVPNEPLFCALAGDDQRWPRWKLTLIDHAAWRGLREFAAEIGIDFSVSVFQKGGLEIAKHLDLPWIKVASRAAKTFPYHEWGGSCIISCGIGLPDKFPDRYKLLHCVPKYPTPLIEAWWAHLMAITHGLSDHSGTPWPAIDAIGEGADVVEVHFALEKEGPDAAVSISTDDLALICRARDEIAPLRPNQRSRSPFA